MDKFEEQEITKSRAVVKKRTQWKVWLDSIAKISKLSLYNGDKKRQKEETDKQTQDIDVHLGNMKNYGITKFFSSCLTNRDLET